MSTGPYINDLQRQCGAFDPPADEEDLSDYDGPQCLAGPHCMGCGLPGCPVDQQTGRLKE